jgi:hypothetical protein
MGQCLEQFGILPDVRWGYGGFTQQPRGRGAVGC